LTLSANLYLVQPLEPEILEPKVKNRSKVKRGLSPLICQLKLEQPNLSNAAIARHVKCSEANVHKVLQKFLSKYSPDQLDQFKASRADVFAGLQMRMLGSITDRQLQKSSPASLVTAAAILYDKECLETGKPTAINVMAIVDLAKLIRERDQ